MGRFDERIAITAQIIKRDVIGDVKDKIRAFCFHLSVCHCAKGYRGQTHSGPP
jgi:hypothetical protein